jgi:hypothetical protein
MATEREKQLEAEVAKLRSDLEWAMREVGQLQDTLRRVGEAWRQSIREDIAKRTLVNVEPRKGGV